MSKKPLYKIDPDSEAVGSGHGYIVVTTTPNAPCAHKKMKDHKKPYSYLHDITWVNHSGKPIPDGYEVHHKDNNPKNNNISNLELRPRESHAKHHKFWKKSPRTKPGHKSAQRVVSAFLSLSD